ncbi:MAG TPA: VTT domain-containing protein [Candidatus Binatia bacterium]|nr:VTT domain-containing protein [Candidatus Binatia bacterium]
MNGSEEPLGDEAAEKRLQSQARRIYVESAIAALILTGVSFFFAGVLPEMVRSYGGLSLKETGEFLIKHGYLLLFGWVLVEQMGLPIPAIPLLLAAGALAGSGKMNMTLAVSLALIAVILADLFWYSLGRYRGGRILKLLCRISLEPDSCVRRTENLFVRHGARSLLVAKFIPGLNTAAPSLAGIFRMPVRRFMLFDTVGGFFWVATFAGLGFIFSDQLEWIAAHSLRWGGWLVAVLAGSLAAYILWKYVQRRRFLHRLRIARISPKELMDKLTAGDSISIVDLRQPIDVEAFPKMIPGALRIAMEEIQERHGEIPRDRDVVLYCS